MRLTFLFIIWSLGSASAQSSLSALASAWQSFAKDSQFQQAHLSLCIIDQQSGKILFERNKDELLPPASTIKTFTTASALHYLKPDFCYQTKFSFKGEIKNNTATGTLMVYAGGDPSLGSDRFPNTSPELLFQRLKDAFKKLGANRLRLHIQFNHRVFNDSSSSRYWLEEDYGNYYGAGLFRFNWRENKFDVQLKPTDTGFEVVYNNGGLNNATDVKLELIPTPHAGTEEAFAYVSKDPSYTYVLRGKMGSDAGIQTLSLASLNPEALFERDFQNYFKEGFQHMDMGTTTTAQEVVLFTHSSPPLVELVKATNQKSLNLYAESLCKTMARVRYGLGNWKQGIELMNAFADRLSIPSEAIQLKDGSGLSPDNKISTYTLAKLLQAYSKQPWSAAFYQSLPIINELHMKSGYIGGTRSYAGYITLPDQRKVTFAFIVHGFNGSPKAVKEKMFGVLNVLK